MPIVDPSDLTSAQQAPFASSVRAAMMQTARAQLTDSTKSSIHTTALTKAFVQKLQT